MSLTDYSNTEIAAASGGIILFAAFLKAVKDIRTLGWQPAKDKWLAFRVARRQRAELITAVGEMKTIIDRELTVNGGGSMKDMVSRIDKKVEHIQARARHQDETSNLAIFELRETGGMSFTNSVFRELVNADERELLHRDYISRMHPDDKARFLNDLRDSIVNKMPLDSNVRFRFDGNKFRWVRMLARPDVRSDGSLMGFFGTAIPADGA